MVYEWIFWYQNGFFFFRHTLLSLSSMIFKWPNQPKLWYSTIFVHWGLNKFEQWHGWFHCLVMFGTGSCSHIHLQLRCVSGVTGFFIWISFCITFPYFQSPIPLLNWSLINLCRRLHGLGECWRPITLLDAFFGFFVVQWSFFWVQIWVMWCTLCRYLSASQMLLWW